MSPNKKRIFSKEFNVEAVKLITEQGYSVKQASHNLGVCATVLRNWKKELESAPGNGDAVFPGKGCLAPADEQLRKLREENRRLRMERDIKKKRRLSLARSRHEIPIKQSPAELVD